MRFSLFDWLATARPSTVYGAGFASMALIAIWDMLVTREFSLGLLYLIPVTALAALLPRWQGLLVALLAAVLTETFGPDGWNADWPARFALSSAAFSGLVLFMAEGVRRRLAERITERRLDRLETEARLVLECSPAAILTVHANGIIDLANESAQRLLGLADDASTGDRRIGDYFPMLGDMLRSGRVAPMTRTMVECRGQRSDGDHFFAQMWLSTFTSHTGPRLVVVVADVSEQMRDREELGLRQLLMNSSIIAGAVSHEIRNLAVAASVIYGNIGSRFQLRGNEDFDALGRLIEALRKLSAPEAPSRREDGVAGLDINALLGELKIIAGSGEFETPLNWQISESLPRVRAEHAGLLQVMLNLLRNSQRALTERADGAIRVRAYRMGDSVVIAVADNGPGVGRPETLFQPFQPGAHATGLGLYVSRAIVRTFGGELQYDRRAEGSRFLIQLPIIEESEGRKVG